MEKDQSQYREIAIDEIVSCPIIAKSFITTILTSLDMSQEIIYDLTMGIGGAIHPDHLPIIKAYLKLTKDYLEDL